MIPGFKSQRVINADAADRADGNHLLQLGCGKGRCTGNSKLTRLF
jgi:hypothetical protein